MGGTTQPLPPSSPVTPRPLWAGMGGGRGLERCRSRVEDGVGVGGKVREWRSRVRVRKEGRGYETEIGVRTRVRNRILQMMKGVDSEVGVWRLVGWM